MTLLGLSLQQRVGDAVLLAALVQFADGIRPRPGESAEVVALHPEAARAQPQDNPGSTG